MTNQKYRPTTLPDALARISEECHDLGKVACKALRFGVYDMHPEKKQRNIQLLIEEWHDINDAMQDFLRLNNDCDYPPFNLFPESKGGETK